MFSSRFGLTISYLVASLLLLFPAFFLYQEWYPLEWRQFVGGGRLLRLLGLAVLIGPVISFIVFKQNRRLLIMDLAVVLIVQILLVSLAMHGLAQGRAQWVAFVKDDWRILRPIDMQPGVEFSLKRLFSGPQWVGARYAEDEEVRAIQVTRELVEGVTVETFTTSHVPVGEVLSDIRSTTRPFSRLLEHNTQEEIQRVLDAEPQAVGWLPLKGIARDGVVLVDAAGNPLKPVALAPWEPD